MGKLFGFIFTGLLGWFNSLSSITRFFFITIFIAALFILLFNLSLTLVESFFIWAVDKMTTVVLDKVSSITGVSLTGPVSWILQRLRISEIISLILTAYSIRVSLKMIPFLKVN